MSARARFLAVAVAMACAVGPFTARGQNGSVSSDPFTRDFQFLASFPHRMTGSAEGNSASGYIEQQLRDAGINEVYTLEMPVWTLDVARCEIAIGGQVVTAFPLKPNSLIVPATPAHGIRAPLVYAGRGNVTEYGSRQIRDAIVALEYDCEDNWKRAFAMGARAVVFLGGDDTPAMPMSIGAAANLVRVYVPPRSAEMLRTDYDTVTLVSHVSWRRSTGKNVLAYIPARTTGRADAGETLVLSAAFDSYGTVPHLSPHARGAANVAGLLDVARNFARRPADRNVLLAFLDAKAFYHEGARQLYTALGPRNVDVARMQSGVPVERAFRESMLAILDTAKQGRFDGPRDMREAITHLLAKQAEFVRTDANQELTALRLRSDGSENVAGQMQQLEQVILRWDNARRAIEGGKIWAVEPGEYVLLREKARIALLARLGELAIDERIAGQRQRIRDRFAGQRILLHLTWHLSDGGRFWGPVVGDDSDNPFRNSSPNVDNPGYYHRVLRAFRDVVSAGDSVGTFVHPEMLRDPVRARQYVQGSFASDGIVAGTFGIYNVALITCNDRRPREGHPTDDILRFGLDATRGQSDDAKKFVRALLNVPGLSLERVFADVAIAKAPRWENSRSIGDFVALQVTGSLSEDRPASEAVIAIAPGSAASFWVAASGSGAIPGFERFCLGTVDQNGRYGVCGVQKELFTTVKVFGALFDTCGVAWAVTSSETMNATFRINLVPANGFTAGYPLSSTGFDGRLLVMDAVSNSPYLASRSLNGAAEGFAFFYVHRNDPKRRMKIFAAQGPVMLGEGLSKEYGRGFELAAIGERHLPADDISAENLWELNEGRLSALRAKNVSDVDLEALHSRARALTARARQTTDAGVRLALMAQSLAVSRQIYTPLRGVMDDLVKAIVILLLLTVPFAFAIERLVLCATSVYLRIAGFCVAFVATFAILYVLHPGFSIAATPMIVFLAFAIILLSGMVINIMTRKFRTELMAFQGRSSKVHNVEISRMETLVTAVNMGMSTMRRRPVRTALTALTAVMLTFTILCFASFTNSFGVRSFYTGASGEEVTAAFLVRNVNYDKVSLDLTSLLLGRGGPDGGVYPTSWLTNQGGAGAVAVALPGQSQTALLDGMVGLHPGELSRWPLIRDVVRSDSLPDDGVFLPSVIQRQLNLAPGDTIIVNGMAVRFVGVFDELALQRLRHLDGQSIVPVNFRDPSYDTTVVRRAAGSADAVASDKIKVQRDYLRLSAGQICIGSEPLVRRLGGTPYLLAGYVSGDIDPRVEGARVAEITGLPVWTRTDRGVERMVFTRLVQVAGGWALFVPLLLGGLIIFGTLLGSIADRQREIYTFSALGLGPAHVGFLFVAEAAVYAIVGGMGGALCAQIFAAGANQLAKLGMIEQPSINFSSTHSLFAIGVVMITVLISAIYPAIKASKSANPGIARTWKMPDPIDGRLDMTFPFTVSAYDMTGVVSFLAEHFRHHEDAGLGAFAAQRVVLDRGEKGNVRLSAHLSLAPFDLGVTQDFSLTALPSEIAGVDEVRIRAERRSGTQTDWHRANRTFVRELRKQFLLWRTLSGENIEAYRMQTCQELGERYEPAEFENAGKDEA